MPRRGAPLPRSCVVTAGLDRMTLPRRACIYLTLGALFIVQAAGQDMPLGAQIALAALMVLTSKGAAGHQRRRPRDADRVAAGVRRRRSSRAESIAVGIALVVGIDRIMSEGRALTNAIGNGVATMVIAKWQGERDEERFQEALRRRARSSARPSARWRAPRRRSRLARRTRFARRPSEALAGGGR